MNDSNWVQKVKRRDRKAHKACYNQPMHPDANPTTVRVCPHGMIFEWHRGGWRPAYPWAIRGGIYDWSKEN